MKFVEVNIGGVCLKLELASTPEEQMRGLMGRLSLGPNEGMVFDYGESVTNPFWMRETYVPLDVAFINEDQQIFAVEALQPLDETKVHPPGPYRWAVEMPRGWFDAKMMTTRCEVAAPIARLGIDL